MHKQNESQLNLRFLKTFALMAERVVVSGKSEDISVSQYNKYLNTLSEVYPALENMAWELNVNYGAEIKIPVVEEGDSYIKSQAFAQLAASVVNEMKSKFPGIRPWYDGDLSAVPQQLGAALVNMVSSASHLKNKYWLDNTLHLSLTEIEMKKSELQQQMYDEIDRRNLSEQVAGIMENFGLNIDEEQGDDDIHDILCDVGNEFLSSSGKIDAGEVATSFRDRLQEKWEIADNDDVFLLSLMAPMENLGRLIRNMQRKAGAWDYPAFYLNKIRKEMVDVPDAEQVQEAICAVKSTQAPSAVKYWKDGRVMPEYLNVFENDERFQKINSESVFWKNYEDAGAMLLTPQWRERIGLIVGGWSQLLWEKCGEIDSRLDDFVEEKCGRADDEFEDDEQEIPGGEDENQEILKEEALTFAEQFLLLSEAAEKYAGVALNTTGISRKTLDNIRKEKNLSDSAVKIFELLIDSFDENYNAADFFAQESVLDEGEDAKVFIEKLSELPHSPEKREVANLMLQSFLDQQDDLESEEEIVTENLVEFIEEQQISQCDILQDFVDYAVRAYPEMSGINPEELADDLNYSISANFIIPLYLDTEPYPNAKEKILEEIDGFEYYGSGAKEYMSGLIDAYVKAVEPVHLENKKYLEEITEEDVQQAEEDSLENAIYEYQDVQMRLTDLQQDIDNLNEIYREEKAVNRKYISYQKNRDMYLIPDQALRRVLMEATSLIR